MLIGEQNTKILPNKAPIMVTWVPRKPGATLPDGENSILNYVDILIKHKQENNEERDMMLFLNDPQDRTNPEFIPGFLPGQIDDLKNKFKGVNGIHIVNLHDPKYDRYWEEIDQGWKINGKPISIKEYYKNMYGMQDENRTHFAIEIDTFRYITAYLMLREQKELNKDPGVIYTDFDALGIIGSSEYKKHFRNGLYIERRGTKQKGIGQDITIPHGVLATCNEKICENNDVFAITDYHILEKVFNDYKESILDQAQMVEVLRAKIGDKSLFDSANSIEVLNKIFYSGYRLSLFEENLAQVSFCSILNNMINDTIDEPIVNDDDMIDIYDELIGSNSIDPDTTPPIDPEFTNEFDFTQNGGEHLPQGYIDSDMSWIKKNLYSEGKKNEQVSKQPDEPSRLIDGIGTKSPSPSACRVQ